MMEMEEDYTEFRKRVVGAGDCRGSKINNSWGVYDSYKWIRKNGWYDIGRAVKEHEFYAVVRAVNKLLAAEIGAGRSVTFPSRMGHLELRKIQTGVKWKNGRLKITYPVDWEKTLRLWFDDDEAREKKLVVRIESGVLFKIKYCKYKANYRNMSYYQFQVNRGIKKMVKEGVIAGRVETMY